MKKAEEIEHPGKVERVNGPIVFVSLETQAACTSCHARGACSVADSSEKIVEIRNPGFPVTIGEQVSVVLQKSLGMKALSLGYMIPLFLLIASLIAFSTMLESEVQSGLFSLGLLGLYYLFLLLSRNKIDKQFTFTIKKLS